MGTWFNPLNVRVAPPRGYDEEFLAQELFTDEVGRILAMDGSRFFTAGNDTLREITEKLGDRRIAVHARVALATPLMCEFKQLVLPASRQDVLEPAAALGGAIKTSSPRMDEARTAMSAALIISPSWLPRRWGTSTRSPTSIASPSAWPIRDCPGCGGGQVRSTRHWQAVACARRCWRRSKVAATTTKPRRRDPLAASAEARGRRVVPGVRTRRLRVAIVPL